MSYYYKYNFVSPEPLYATVKEELKSYFDTGAVDDLLFPTYLDKCLRKLGRSTYTISETALFIEDFQAKLPDNFYAVREAWMCSEIPGHPYRTANSFYSQALTQDTIQVSPVTVGGKPCSNVQTYGTCNDDLCPSCMPEVIQAVYKTNQEIARVYRKDYLLKPGNISALQSCNLDYTGAYGSFTPGSASYDSFDVRDDKLITSFRNGIVHLIFYSLEHDELGNQLVPDNYRIREYVEAFIKYKVFEQLFNQINDETYKQIEAKLMMYKQQADEAFIMADIELKKQTPWEKQRRIKNSLKRFGMYELPNRVNRFGRRRNN